MRTIPILVTSLCICLTMITPAHTMVFADVSPISFSVIWTASEPSTGSLLVFDEQLQEVTGAHIEFVSTYHPPAEDLGVMKVTVSSLEPDSTYYVQTVTTSKSDGKVTIFPDDPISVHTQKSARVINNVSIAQDVYFEDGIYAVGSIVTMFVAGSNYPISGWVGDSISPPYASVDTNNCYDATTLMNMDLLGGEIVIIEVFGGTEGYGREVDIVPEGAGIKLVGPPIVLHPASDISGCINLKGKPLADTKLILMQFGEGKQTTVTDAEGCYEFKSIASSRRFWLLLSSPAPSIEADKKNLKNRCVVKKSRRKKFPK